MPVLLTKIEGKGNGIKTVIPNMTDIAKALARPPTYPTKYFGCELGAQTTFDEKNERYIVNGAHDASRLRELLTTFIDKFVLCPNCKNPETDLYISGSGKREKIYRDCKACGHHQDVDMTHKLTTFILKNPPANARKASGKKSKADKAAAKNGSSSPKEEDDGAIEAGSDDELTKTIESGAANIRLQDDDNDGENGKGGWSVDTSAEAVRHRQKTLQAGVQSLLQADDDDENGEAEDSPYTAFEAWVAGEARDGSASDIEIYKKAAELGIDKKYKVLQFLVQGLFTPTTIVSPEEVGKHAALFKKLINASAKAGSTEKQLKSVLGGIEAYVGLLHPDLDVDKTVPRILMAFYQADILDDEELPKTWASHVSKKYVDKATCKKIRRAATPFIAWLDEESEEESEEEDDNDHDDEEDEDDA